jgi:DNA-binding response OmpR family regulator
MEPEPAILIVEDYEHLSRALVRSVSGLLAHLRHGVVAVSTLEQAREATARLRCAAVITDWSFPLRSGESPTTGAGASVVSACLDAGVPVLVLSGDPRPASFPAGARWLAKPAEREDLRAFLADALALKERA